MWINMMNYDSSNDYSAVYNPNQSNNTQTKGDEVSRISSELIRVADQTQTVINDTLETVTGEIDEYIDYFYNEVK